MTFARLSQYWLKIEKTASRLEMTAILADLLKETDSDEVSLVCYLSQGRLGPLFEPLEFKLAEKTMIRVVAQAMGVTETEIVKKYKEAGDLGIVTEVLTSQVKSAQASEVKVSIKEVYARLKEIAQEEGRGSVERKINKMAGLLGEVDELSVRYLMRIPLGKMRLGFSDLTVLDALSWMVGGDKSRRGEIEAAYSVMADAGMIGARIKKEGIEGLKRIGVELGVPVLPALCQRLPNTGKMIEKMIGEDNDLVAVEPKYDGSRVQVHFSKVHPTGPAAGLPPKTPILLRQASAGKVKGTLFEGLPTRVTRSLKLFNELTEKEQLGFGFEKRGYVRMFTRSLENVTAMFPEIGQAVLVETTPREAVLDGEVIGVDPKTGELLPFQETIKRKRKYDIGQKAKEIPLRYYVFDVLYADGRSLIHEPFNKRRQLLEKLVKKGSQVISVSPQMVTAAAAEISDYHRRQKEMGLEGVVVKKWRAPYDPGKRGYTWVKLKSDEAKKGAGLADTVDAVVMGYYRGKGKRAGFGVGAFLVGVRKNSKTQRIKEAKQEKTKIKNKNRESELNYLTISKIGTGLTDEQWRELKGRSLKFEVRNKPEEYEVDKNLEPDVWLRPGMMVEIQADNITRSPTHSADLALRFPRLVRFRDDKTPEQATSLEEMEKLYGMQEGISNK